MKNHFLREPIIIFNNHSLVYTSNRRWTKIMKSLLNHFLPQCCYYLNDQMFRSARYPTPMIWKYLSDKATTVATAIFCYGYWRFQICPRMTVPSALLYHSKGRKMCHISSCSVINHREFKIVLPVFLRHQCLLSCDSARYTA